MRIAFDLDDTLIPGPEPFSCGLEPLPRLAQSIAPERLRAGTIALFRDLRRRGCDTWVYTSSMRPWWRVRWHFAVHGLSLGGVVNDRAHREAEVRAHARWPLKYPPAFGIDLLVDDSLAVLEASRQHGFSALRVERGDAAWASRVVNEVKAMQAKSRPARGR